MHSNHSTSFATRGSPEKSYHPIREQLPANNAPVIHHTSILRTSESQIAFLSFCTQPFLFLSYISTFFVGVLVFQTSTYPHTNTHPFIITLRVILFFTLCLSPFSLFLDGTAPTAIHHSGISCVWSCRSHLLQQHGATCDKSTNTCTTPSSSSSSISSYECSLFATHAYIPTTAWGTSSTSSAIATACHVSAAASHLSSTMYASLSLIHCLSCIIIYSSLFSICIVMAYQQHYQIDSPTSPGKRWVHIHFMLITCACALPRVSRSKRNNLHQSIF